MPEKGGRVLKGRGEPKGFPRGREETGRWRAEGGLEKSLEGDLGPGLQKSSQRAERGQPGGLRKLPRARGQGTPGNSLFLEPCRSLPTPLQKANPSFCSGLIPLLPSVGSFPSAFILCIYFLIKL